VATAPTNAAFLERYPEYNGAPAALVTARLAEAARRTNEEVFQTDELVTDAVMLRAAVLLLASPHGFKIRAAAPDQAFAWEYTLRQLQRSATQGLRVF
jgi:hypothetical protein